MLRHRKRTQFNLSEPVALVVEYMTARIPMRRTGSMEEAAAISAFIVSKECSFCTVFVFDISGGRATY